MGRGESIRRPRLVGRIPVEARGVERFKRAADRRAQIPGPGESLATLPLLERALGEVSSRFC